MTTDVTAGDHAQRMARKKSARERILLGKSKSKGLFVVHTGVGKGKSSAAFGMVLRCIGHGLKTGVVQFIKGARNTAERRVLSDFPGLVTFLAIGEGFTWETQNRDLDMANARRAWEVAEGMLADSTYHMVVLDELNVSLRYQHLPLENVLTAIRARPRHQHVVVTGRHAPKDFVETADLVTEMTLIRHPFRSGIRAQPGIEY